MRIIFLGTPDFAVPTLEALFKAGFEIVAVVTAPDKPAGRGLQLKSSPVKEVAERLGIPVLQPERLKDPAFISALASLKPDIQVVVAFRMLPEAVWNLPPLGTWNLHGSLLPQYRGAAPINHAIINGESETGLTTFKLVQAIDQGAIAKRQRIPILPDETAGELHDRMMGLGAELMLETIKEVNAGTIELIPQEQLVSASLNEAPKLNADFCGIRFDKPAVEVHNHIRGLSPFPGAHAIMIHSSASVALKIYRTRISTYESEAEPPGTLRVLDKKTAIVRCGTGWVELLELQLAGKKRLLAADFLIGYRFSESDRLE